MKYLKCFSTSYSKFAEVRISFLCTNTNVLGQSWVSCVPYLCRKCVSCVHGPQTLSIASAFLSLCTSIASIVPKAYFFAIRISFPTSSNLRLTAVQLLQVWLKIRAKKQQTIVISLNFSITIYEKRPIRTRVLRFFHLN